MCKEKYVVDNIAKISLDNTVYHIDKLYDYRIPHTLLSKIQKGVRVTVGFGRGNRKCQGMVFSTYFSDETDNLKPIINVLDETPILNDEMLELAAWMKNRTFCRYYNAVKTMLPSGLQMKIVNNYSVNPDFDVEKISDVSEKEVFNLVNHAKTALSEKQICDSLGLENCTELLGSLVKAGALLKDYDSVRRVNDATEKMVRLCVDDETVSSVLPKLTSKQKAVVKVLLDVGSASVKELCYFSGCTANVVSTLEKKGYVEVFSNRVYRRPSAMPTVTCNRPKGVTLNDEQQCAYENLLSQYRCGRAGVSLLYGVTGSGKTQVFLKLVDEVVRENKGVIVMIPEISLTPQTLSIFYSRYGDKVAVFHSGLSMGERLDEWYRVKKGEAFIAIGTRSAVFAPFENLGLIIIDEEHEHTYKSEASPRYHARDVAKFRSVKNNSLLVLASATPSIESYTNAVHGKYTLNKLTKRYSGAELPNVTVIDMQNERVHGSISETMLYELKTCIDEGHQAIILMNRRGYSTYAACKSCKEVEQCPNCSISLTYHNANGRLMCHYCGYSFSVSDGCNKCDGKEFSFFGSGTQRVESDISQMVVGAKVLRLDADTTMSKFAYENKLKQFANGEYNILIGTQMVAKGLDFANVTLAGVLSADQMLYSDDFRSVERTFDLLTQVVGRSGRGEFKGRALVQTYTPESPIIRLASAQDYESFYETEIATRKLLVYPPFCDMCVLSFTAKDEGRAVTTAYSFLERIKSINEKRENQLNMIVLGPVSARVAKISNKYRYRIIIKCRNSVDFRNMISGILCEFDKSKQYSDVSIYADINPDSII
ncbi:MAG: primosomal protein N' [Clostridia bacterium]|nr:primosomal protein N' [Clostridia bacterium]